MSEQNTQGNGGGTQRPAAKRTRAQRTRPAQHAPAHQAQRPRSGAQQPRTQPQRKVPPQQRPAQREPRGSSKTLVIVLVVVLVVVVALGVVLFLTQCQGKRDAAQTTQSADQNAQVTQENTDAKQGDSATSTDKASTDTTKPSIDKSSWELTLVNKTHPLPDGWKIELAEVADGKYVDARIADQFNQMIEDCRAAGFDDVFVNQAYRSHEEQQAIWDEFYNGYIAQGYSEEEATKLTGESVAIPGTSEHELGLAADICSINFDEEYNAPIQTWLRENGYKYGFIQRYPEGKESVTGTKNENWHFRYVGTDAAKQIHDSGVVLEEYLGEVDTTS